MMKKKNYLIGIAIGIVAIGSVAVGFAKAPTQQDVVLAKLDILINLLTQQAQKPQKLAGISPEARNRCVSTVSSSTGLLWGQDTRILGTSSERSFAWIQVEPMGTSTFPTTGVQASTTIAVSFDDIPAATSSGIQLANGTSSVPAFIKFGLDTDFPTVGAVHVNALQGAAVIHVTTCNYPTTP